MSNYEDNLLRNIFVAQVATLAKAIKAENLLKEQGPPVIAIVKLSLKLNGIVRRFYLFLMRYKLITNVKTLVILHISLKPM